MNLKTDFYKFIYKFQISICIAFGMLGFVFSVWLFAIGNGQDRKGVHYTPYGEIIILNKTPLIDILVAKRIKKLESALISTKLALKGDSNNEQLKKDLIILNIAHLNSIKELDSIRNASADTSLAVYSKYIFPKKTEYLQALDSGWKADGSQIKVVHATLLDTSKLVSNKFYNANLKLAQNKRTTLIAFFSDYPQFGLWLVLTIAQMMMWFLLVPLLTGNLLNLHEKLGVYYKISLIGIAQRMIIPFLFISIFCYCFYDLLADRTVINDSYFFSNYNTYLIIYAVFGYAVAVYCFGTYLSLASQVSALDRATKGKKLRSNNAKLDEQYKSLKNAFDNSFLASALILSIFVLWTGVTIHAVNNTEAIKFYGIMMGKSLIPEDFVYLLGLTHTCILLTFYLPVKLKFNSLPITQDPAGNAPVKTIFSTLGQSLSTILVTASPLIASFIQKIMEVISK